MSQNRIYIIILVLVSLISALGGILGNIASGVLPEAWGPYLWLAWPLFAFFLLVGIGLLIWQLRIEEKIVPPSHADQLKTQPHPPSSDLDAEAAPEPLAEPDSDATPHREDWGEAVDVEIFYGREEELATLESWLITGRCRFVALLGMGGIGKTALVTKLAQQVKDEFDYVIWRSLRNAPPVEDILEEYIKFLSDQAEIDLPEDVGGIVALLIEYLREHRCLLVLDNAEAILTEGDRAGHYREGYEAYGNLIRRVAETSHQSCLLLTSREKPREVALLEGKTSPVRSIQLAGLGPYEGKQLLQDRGLVGTDEAWIALGDHYSGNPLALNLVAETIREVFGGNIAVFLREGATVFGGIHDVLDEQFSRLSAPEREIMYWLAIEREAISPGDLQENIPRPVSKREFVEALRSLRRRSLAEQSARGFTLQNVVMEFVTDHLVDQVCEEVNTETVSVFQSHALIKAEARDYIRESQVRLILRPVASQLLAILGQEGVENNLRSILSMLREAYPRQPGYAGGNAFNLFVQLKTDLSKHDFSNLSVWQAYLRGVNLHDVSFAHSDFARSVFTATFGGILSVAFSPSGKLLAAGSTNREVRIWQVADMKELLACEGHTDWIRTVIFSPDGRTLASGGEDHTVRLWDAGTGQHLDTLQGHADRIRSVAYSPDGRILASAGRDCTVRLWDTTGGECLGILQGHTASIRSVAFSPDGNTLASGSRDQTIRLWDVNTGQCLKILRGHTDRVRSIAFGPAGDMLVSGSVDQTVRLWDVNTGRCLRILEGHTAPVLSVAFNREGDMLASAGYDRTIRLWEAGTGQQFIALQGHAQRVEAVAFSPDGRTLASGSIDQTLRLWDIRTGQCLNYVQGYTNRISSIAISPDGLKLASGSQDQVVRLWDITTGQRLKALHGHADWVRTVVFSPDGLILASGSEDLTIRLWDVNTGRCLRILEGHTAVVSPVAFSPDGKILATGGYDQTVRLWDTGSGQCFRIIRGHNDAVASVAFNPNGNILAVGNLDHSIWLWEVTSGECVRTLEEHTGRVWSVDFSPRGRILASGSEDQTVKLWDVSTGQCFRTMQGHTHPIWPVSFSPDGRLLASGSIDETVRLWDVATGDCLRTLHEHAASVTSVEFSSDSDTLISSSDDGTIRLWDIQSGDCLKMLRPDRPYERMNITGVTGLSESQKSTLMMLGAFEIREC